MNSSIASRLAWLAAIVLAVAIAPATAQTPPPAAPKAAPQAAAPGQPQLPSLEELVYIIRNMTIAINQANVTDNYSVLLALSAPEFQKTNTIDSLRTRYAAIRTEKIDFGVTLAVAPQFSEMPNVDATGMLRLTGFYPTRPRITFDFGFRQIDGRWLPIGYGIGVIPQPAPEPEAKVEKKGPAEKAGSKRAPATPEKKSN